MGARQKLNQIQVAGSLGLAALAGLATGSLVVFLIAGTVLIAAGLATSEIRPDRQRRR